MRRKRHDGRDPLTRCAAPLLCRRGSRVRVTHSDAWVLQDTVTAMSEESAVQLVFELGGGITLGGRARGFSREIRAGRILQCLVSVSATRVSHCSWETAPVEVAVDVCSPSGSRLGAARGRLPRPPPRAPHTAPAAMASTRPAQPRRKTIIGGAAVPTRSTMEDACVPSLVAPRARRSTFPSRSPLGALGACSGGPAADWLGCTHMQVRSWRLHRDGQLWVSRPFPQPLDDAS